MVELLRSARARPVISATHAHVGKIRGVSFRAYLMGDRGAHGAPLSLLT
jgi:hypothetical protein